MFYLLILIFKNYARIFIRPGKVYSLFLISACLYQNITASTLVTIFYAAHPLTYITGGSLMLCILSE